MRPSLDYIIDKFDYYNALCFDGKLSRPPIRLNTRLAALGITRSVPVFDSQGCIVSNDLSIEISVRLDLPEEEYIDTLVHEMIHYYIMSNNMNDDSPHGTLFRSKMKEITDKYGIKITIRLDPTDEELVMMRSHPRCVCVVTFCDGRVGIAVVARNKLFRFWNIFSLINGVEETRWYVSDRAIFGKFPVSVSPCLKFMDADKVHHYLTGALELENDGSCIKTKR